MNNLFFGIVCTLVGGFIGGAITVSSPQDQKTITNYLLAATGGVVAVWSGYGLGKWQASYNEKSEISQSSTDPTVSSSPTASTDEKYQASSTHTSSISQSNSGPMSGGMQAAIGNNNTQSTQAQAIPVKKMSQEDVLHLLLDVQVFRQSPYERAQEWILGDLGFYHSYVCQRVSK
jgi:hypothetical protein